MLVAFVAIILGTASSALPAGGPAAVWHVSPSGSDTADGRSWQSAKATIQSAMDAAAAAGGGEVWVAEGVYSQLQSTAATESFESIFPDAVDIIGEERDLEYTSSGEPRTAHISILYLTGSTLTPPPPISVGWSRPTNNFATRMQVLKTYNPDVLFVVNHPSYAGLSVSPQDLAGAANTRGMLLMEVKHTETEEDTAKWDYALANLDDQAGACTKIVWGVVSDDRHFAEPYLPFAGVMLGSIPTADMDPAYQDRRTAFADMMRRGSIVGLPLQYKCGVPEYGLFSEDGTASRMRVGVYVDNVNASAVAVRVDFHGCDPLTGASPGSLLCSVPVPLRSQGVADFWLTTNGREGGVPLTPAQKANIRYVRPTVTWITPDNKVRRALLQPVRIRASGAWWDGPGFTLAGSQGITGPSPYPSCGGREVYFNYHCHSIVSDGDAAPSSVRALYRAGDYLQASAGAPRFAVVTDHNSRTPFAPPVANVLALRENVHVFGGFAGTETAREQRDPDAHRSIIDPDRCGRCVYVDGSGWADRAASTLDGFVLRNGNALTADGGGMYVWEGSPAITGCEFTGNSARCGGGLFVSGGSPTVKGCIFDGNSAITSGGGACCERGSAAVFTTCVFLGNECGDKGGGLSLASSPALVEGCSFVENLTNGSAAWNNFSGGAGVYLQAAAATINRCDFLRNTCLGDADGGAGVRVNSRWKSALRPVVANSLFDANISSHYRGGAVYLNDTSAVVANNTLLNNKAVSGGGFAFASADGALVANNIVFLTKGGCGIAADALPGPERLSNLLFANYPAHYSGLDAAPSDIFADPMFVDRLAGDYRLRPGSPAIDQGLNGVFGIGSADYAGLPRVLFESVDIGMHEYAPTPNAPVVLDDGAYAAVALPLRARWSMPPGNPAVPSLPIVEYLYALGTSPSDPGSGYTVPWTSAGNSQMAEVEVPGLLAGVEYYWYVRARNSSGLLGPAGVSDGIRIVSSAVSSPGAARDLPDGSTVSIGHLAVTAAPFPSDSLMYVEALDRSSGIAVRGSQPAAVGDRVVVAGELATLGTGERVIRDANVIVTGRAAPLEPLGVTCGAVLAGVAGSSSDPGVSTQGLLVRISGRICMVDEAAGWFAVSDGSQGAGGGGACGIRVTPSSAAAFRTGQHVNVTGVVSCCTVEGRAFPLLRVRSAGDIVLVRDLAE